MSQLSFSPDGNILAVGGYHGNLKIWNIINGSLLWEGNHQAEISSILFTPDGSKIITGESNSICKVKVWDISTGNHNAKVFMFSPLGNEIISCGEYKICFWRKNINKSIYLISPNFSEQYSLGDTLEIKWISTDIQSINIDFSTDNGITWNNIASNISAKSGSYLWQIPKVISNSCLIKVSDYNDQNIFDISDQTFSIIGNMYLSYVYKFDSNNKHSSEKLIGLPGDVNFSIIELFSTSNKVRGIDWNVFWDNGEDYNYKIEFDNSSTFNFSPGKAFWIISKNDIAVNRNVNAVTLNDDGTYAISLHKSWNLISNPFDKSISWEDVKTINGITQPIWDFEGSYSEATNFKPYKGYYFFNATNLTQLKIPYVSSLKKKSLYKQSNDSLIARISLYKDNNKISSVRICINKNAADTLDEFDVYSPGVNEEDINIVNESISPRKRYQKADYRNKIKEKNEYKIEVANSNNESLRLKAEENNTAMEIYLIDEEAKMIYDLAKGYEIPKSIKKKIYKVVLTTEEEIEKIKQEFLPKEFYLSQNYPNPFNISTIINYSLPEDQTVTMELYNVIGQKVSTVMENKYHEAGNYKIEINGSKLASGIYLLKMHSEKYSKIIKMVLMK